MFHKLIKTEDARNGKAMLKNELELAKKELEEWEERDCTLCYRSKRAEWDGNSDLYELLEEPLLEAVSKCRALRQEIEAIEEALEALEAYEQAIEYLETVWNEQG